MPSNARDLWRVYFAGDSCYYTVNAPDSRRAAVKARRTLRKLAPMFYRRLARRHGGRPIVLAVHNLNAC